MTKDEARSAIMGAISMTLKDPILQQGFEIICKENAELKRNLEQTEKDLSDYQFNYPTIKELQEENAKLKEKLKPENCLKLLAKEGYIKFSSEQLSRAREILKGLYFIIQSRIDYENNTGIADEMARAEQFLKEL